MMILRTAFSALLGMVLPALAVAQGGSISNPRPLSCSIVAQACNVSIPSSGALLTTTGNGSGLTNLSGTQLGAGSLALGKVAPIADKTILANITGASASPAANSLTALLDNILGSTQGSIIFRGASTWSVLTAGTSGLFLQTQGASANPQWAAPSGNGSGLTNLSGAQLGAGSLALSKVAAIADKTILANITGASASPAANSLTALLDNILGSAQGSIIFRGASSWSVLTAGISGQFLQTQGASGNPQWGSPSGSGTVSNGTANQLAYYASSGTAVSGTTTLPNGTTATTQATGDNTTKVATTAGVLAEIGVAMPTGVVMPYVGSAAPGGWLLMWGTIGNAASGASNRANADTLALYTLLWNSMADAQAPVLPGGRGASAAADFAANKTIAVPDMRGRIPAGKDNMGGTTASRLTASGLGVAGTTLGVSGGADTHTLTVAQMPSHGHGVTDPTHTHGATGTGAVGNNLSNGTSRAVGTGDGVNAGYFQDVAVTIASAATGISIQNNGGGGAHPNVQPTLVLNYIIRMRRRPANDNARAGVRHRRRRRAA